MDLNYVLSNDKALIEKALALGHDEKSMGLLIKDLRLIIVELPNDEIDDFVYKLKISHDLASGKTLDLELENKVFSRVSVLVEGKMYFFKLYPTEIEYKKMANSFYCEMCGLETRLKPTKFKKHVINSHIS
jgi:hypothetical protein